MKDEIEIYRNLKDKVFKYLCKYLNYGKHNELIILRNEIKTLCWVLDRMDLYKELPKNRTE